jgi:hypothetical protein
LINSYLHHQSGPLGVSLWDGMEVFDRTDQFIQDRAHT